MDENEARAGLEVGQFLKSTEKDIILQEIFLRLPNFFSAVDCSRVCKRWRRLIRDSIFSNTFKRRLDGSATPMPLTLVFSRSEDPAHENRYRHITKFLVSENLSKSSSPAFHRQLRRFASPDCIDFLPEWHHYTVHASCNDLLLVQLRMKLCVCNPMTGQTCALPDYPRPQYMVGNYRFALVCNPVSGRGYRVVLFMEVRVCVYNSETLQWGQDLLLPPEPEEMLDHMPWKVTNQNGVVYTRAGDTHNGFLLKKIFVFDPFDLLGRMLFVGLPPGFEGGWRAMGNRANIWVVRGQLRLWQAYWDEMDNRSSFVFRLWKLRLHSGEWIPLHNLALTRTGDMFAPGSCVIALDAEDNDTFYVMDSRQCLWQYHIGSGTSLRINIDISSAHLPLFHVLPLVHPPWPTDVK